MTTTCPTPHRVRRGPGLELNGDAVASLPDVPLPRVRKVLEKMHRISASKKEVIAAEAAKHLRA